MWFACLYHQRRMSLRVQMPAYVRWSESGATYFFAVDTYPTTTDTAGPLGTVTLRIKGDYGVPDILLAKGHLGLCLKYTCHVSLPQGSRASSACFLVAPI